MISSLHWILPFLLLTSLGAGATKVEDFLQPKVNHRYPGNLHDSFCNPESSCGPSLHIQAIFPSFQLKNPSEHIENPSEYVENPSEQHVENPSDSPYGSPSDELESPADSPDDELDNPSDSPYGEMKSSSSFAFVAVANGVSVLKVPEVNQTENPVVYEIAFFKGCLNTKRSLQVKESSLYAVHAPHKLCSCPEGNCTKTMIIYDAYKYKLQSSHPYVTLVNDSKFMGFLKPVSLDWGSCTYNFFDCRGKIALIQHDPRCSLTNAFQGAQAAGAAGILVINSRHDLLFLGPIDGEGYSLPVMLITRGLGLSLWVASQDPRNYVRIEFNSSLTMASNSTSKPGGLWAIDFMQPESPVLALESTAWFHFAESLYSEPSRPYLYVSGPTCLNTPSSGDWTKTGGGPGFNPNGGPGYYNNSTNGGPGSNNNGTSGGPGPNNNSTSGGPGPNNNGTSGGPGPNNNNNGTAPDNPEDNAGRSCHGGFLVLDITNPLRPVKVSEWAEDQVSSVIVEKVGKAYLLYATSSSNRVIYIMDVTHPSRLGRSVLHFRVDDPVSSAHPSPDGHFLFTPLEQRPAITVWNITNPMSIQEVGEVSSPPSASGPSSVIVQRGLLWMADPPSHSVFLYNITTPGLPTLLGSFNASGAAQPVTQPKHANSSSSPAFVQDASAMFLSPATNSKYLWVCDTEGGIYLLEYLGEVPPDHHPKPFPPPVDSLEVAVILAGVGSFVVGGFMMMVCFFVVTKNGAPAGYTRVTTNEVEEPIELSSRWHPPPIPPSPSSSSPQLQLHHHHHHHHHAEGGSQV